MSTLNKPKVDFRIYRKDGSKVPTLIKAFLVKENITSNTLEQGKIVLEDGTEWEIVWDSHLQPADINYCIISYQAHTTGNYAVCRPVLNNFLRNITVANIKEFTE